VAVETLRSPALSLPYPSGLIMRQAIAKEQVLFRVTKERWERHVERYDDNNNPVYSEWSRWKHEVDYRTREGDVKLALKYAKDYTTNSTRYDVHVEVAFMPRFHDYDEVKKMSPTSLIIGILKARGRASHGEPSQLGQS
jgi:hypothetical protein